MKILIFDNNKDFVNMLQKPLTDKYEICTAGTCYAAKEYILKNNFEVILASIEDMDGDDSGINLLRIIKASAIETPVIMIASKSDVSLAVECFKLGAFDCVDKTGDNESTVLRIINAIDKAIDTNSINRKNLHSEMSDFNVLFIDDNVEFTDTISFHFGKKYKIYISNAFLPSKDIIEKKKYDCIFLDIKDEVNNDNKAGIKLLKGIMDTKEHIPVVMLTGWGEMSTAIECLKLGAYSFLEKSIKIFDTIEKVGSTIQELLEKKEKDNSLSGQSYIGHEYSVIDIIGECSLIKNIRREIIELANHDVPVLLYGETGTGKEMVSSAIHVASARRDYNFVEVDCGSIPESIFESELFGYEKGAFTGALNQRKGKIELAHKGTLFLDEIENISLDQQAKLLRVLEEKKIYPLGSNKERLVDFRLICATNIDLLKLVEEGKFREDLLYRINVFRIELPPLRERGEEDIDLLVKHFIGRTRDCVIENAALDLLKKYDWPGNAREVKNLLKKFEILARSDNNNIISLEIVKEGFAKFKSRDKIKQLLNDLVEYYDASVSKMLRDFEDIAVLESYKNFNQNISKIAQRVYRESPEDNKNYRARVRKVLERNKHLLNDDFSKE